MNIPKHLRDAHYGGAKDLGIGTEYKFPHNYPNHYVKQQYLPNRLKDKTYYHAGANKIEQGFVGYQNFIKQKVKKTLSSLWIMSFLVFSLIGNFSE